MIGEAMLKDGPNVRPPSSSQVPVRCLLHGIAAFLVLAIVASLTHPASFNSSTFKFAHFWTHQGDNLFVALSVLVIIGPLLALWTKTGAVPHLLLRMAAATILEFVVVDGIGKAHFKAWHRPHSPDPGFPSGHATGAFLVAWFLTYRFPKLSTLWFLIAIFISWSRLALNAHYPYQALGGAAFGLLIGYATSTIPFGNSRPASDQ